VTAFLSRHPEFAKGEILALTAARKETDGFCASMPERQHS